MSWAIGAGAAVLVFLFGAGVQVIYRDNGCVRTLAFLMIFGPFIVGFVAVAVWLIMDTVARGEWSILALITGFLIVLAGISLGMASEG